MKSLLNAIHLMIIGLKQKDLFGSKRIEMPISIMGMK